MLVFLIKKSSTILLIDDYNLYKFKANYDLFSLLK